MERGITEESTTATEKIPNAPRCVSQYGGVEEWCIPELAICSGCLTKILIQALSWTYDSGLSIEIKCLTLHEIRTATACTSPKQ
jgi:hypothetical protein